MTEKATMEALARLVPEGSRVLDLGCGDGRMLASLQRSRGCSGYAIEIADANVLACVQRGVNVVQLNLDGGLTMFDEASFDVVLQLDTLQHLRNAEVMLRETARVGRLGIVAFPNFAHWPNRLSVLRGRMPVTRPTIFAVGPRTWPVCSRASRTTSRWPLPPTTPAPKRYKNTPVCRLMLRPRFMYSGSKYCSSATGTPCGDSGCYLFSSSLFIFDEG